MPVSSFSNRSFAYKRGDKEKRIVARVGPYPINKPVDTTSNSVEYTRYISGMYAFGHTPGPPNYGTLAGGTGGTYNHGWWNAQSSVTNVAYFQQIFDQATSHTTNQIDGQLGFKTVSFHGPNNILYGWIEHNQRWSNDPGDAQTSVGSGSLGGGNTILQVNGPGSGVAYTYYFDPNTIDGASPNTDSPTMDDLVDLRFWSGSYPTGDVNNHQVGVNGLIVQSYIRRDTGFQLQYVRDDLTASGPNAGFGAEFFFSNSTPATKWKNMMYGVVQPSTNATDYYTKMPNHKPLRLHFADGTTGDIGPDDGSTTERTWSAGGSGTRADVYTTAADNGSRTMSFTGHAGETQAGGGSTLFDGTGDYLESASSLDFTMGTGDFTVECWFKPEFDTSTDYTYQKYLWEIGNQRVYITIDNGTLYLANFAIGAIANKSIGNIQGEWHHVAVTKESNVYTLWYDGQSQGSATDSNEITGPTGNEDLIFRIANHTYFSGGPYYFPGYVSNMRVIKGTALYTSNFTVPTSPLTKVTNTVLLTCQDTTGTITDNSDSNHTMTVFGNSMASTHSPFGSSTTTNGSYYFSSLNAWNGTNARVITASSNDFNLPDGTDVTVEFWYKIPVTPPTQGNGYLFDLGDGNYGWLAAYAWNQNGTHTLRIGTYFGAIWLPPSGSEVGMTQNQWYHCAITRESGTWKVYLDGVFQGSKANSALGSFDTYPDRISLGGFHNLTYPNYGVVSYISDFRFVKGLAVYTGNFTPPSGPLTTTGGTYSSMTNITNPSSAQTLLLTAQNSSGSFVDNSQYSRSLTSYNTVTTEVGVSEGIDFDWTTKEINGISHAMITGHGGHDDPYRIGQNLSNSLFHNNASGQTEYFHPDGTQDP